MHGRHVLFVWRRPSPPFFIGGAEVSQNLLAEALAASGYKVTYIGSYEHSRIPGLSEIQRMEDRLSDLNIAFTDNNDHLHYQWRNVDCWLTRQQKLAQLLVRVVKKEHPDITITAQEGSAELIRLVSERLFVIGWLHSVSRVGLNVLDCHPDVALATSNFVASRCTYVRKTRVVVFYPPFVEPVHRLSSNRRSVLMINPVPEKGSALVYQLARLMPDRHFTLVEGWWHPEDVPVLPNVLYLGKQWCMDQIYSETRLLLVPSVVEEGFGRVVIEAGLHGIPSLGTNRGGLVEAIGHGGIILDSFDLQEWRKAIETLDDVATYESFSKQASHNARAYLRPIVEELRVAGVL